MKPADHIEVVREALASRWGGDYRFPGMPEQLWKDANAALDSLEAELAQVRAERDHNARTAAELDRQLVQVREERDLAFREGVKCGKGISARYREALERIAKVVQAVSDDWSEGFDAAADIARAALTEETELEAR